MNTESNNKVLCVLAVQQDKQTNNPPVCVFLEQQRRGRAGQYILLH